MIGDDVTGLQRLDLVEDGKPALRAPLATINAGHDFVLHDVAGNERAIGFDEDQLVAPGVTGAEPKQARRDAAQIELEFAAGKGHVGRAQFDAGEEFLVLR